MKPMSKASLMMKYDIWELNFCCRNRASKGILKAKRHIKRICIRGDRREAKKIIKEELNQI